MFALTLALSLHTRPLKPLERFTLTVLSEHNWALPARSTKRAGPSLLSLQSSASISEG